MSGGESQAEYDDLEHACSMQSVEDQAAIKDTVEPPNRLGNPELIVRSDSEPAMLAFRVAVIRELNERFGFRAIAQAPPKYDSASAGMVENVIKQVKEKVRTLVIATRELHGVVMNPQHVALAWCVRFACQIISRTMKGADGLTAFQRAFQRVSHPRAMLAAWREKILCKEAGKKKVRITDKLCGRYLLGHQGRFWGVHCRNTRWLCGLQNCQKTASGRRSRSCLFEQHP